MITNAAKQVPVHPCIYCGSTDAITDDHVPPKCVVPRIAHCKLLRVSCCNKCNQKFSFNDEYFQLMLLLRDDVFGHPAAQELYQKVIRSLASPKKQKTLRRLKQHISRVDICTPSGLFLGNGDACAVDLTRLNSVASRIVRALYFKHKGVPVTTSQTVSAWSEDAFDERYRNNVTELHQTIVAPLFRQPQIDVEPGVFCYRFLFAVDNECASVWWLEFFGSVRFLGCTT